MYASEHQADLLRADEPYVAALKLATEELASKREQLRQLEIDVSRLERAIAALSAQVAAGRNDS
jgi:hypothetical protein